MPAGNGGRGSSLVRHLWLDAAMAFRKAPEKFSTHMSIVIPLCNTGGMEFYLPSGFGSWPSQCAWNQGHPVGVDRMNDMQCRWVPGGVPSLVPSTKSDIPEREVLHHHDIQDIGSSGDVVCDREGFPFQRLDRSTRRHYHVGFSPISCSAASFNPSVCLWSCRPTGPAILRRNRRSGPVRSLGGKGRGKP